MESSGKNTLTPNGISFNDKSRIIQQQSSNNDDLQQQRSHIPQKGKHQTEHNDNGQTVSTNNLNLEAIKSRKKSYRCRICGAVFPDRSSLISHSRTHKDPKDKPYSCRHCDKIFLTKALLEQHMQTHSDYKPFKCRYCPLSFKRLNHCKQHLSLHTGERPFSCDWPTCGRSFKQLAHLLAHKKRHKNNLTENGKSYEAGRSFNFTENMRELRRSSKETFSQENNPSTSNFSNTSYVKEPVIAAQIAPARVDQDKAKIVPYMCVKCSKLFACQRKYLEHQAQCIEKFQQSASTTVSEINNSFPNKIESDKMVSSGNELSNSSTKYVTIIENENAQQLMDDLFKVISPSDVNTSQSDIQVSSGYEFSASNMSSNQISLDNCYSHQTPSLTETMVNDVGYNNSSIQSENPFIQNFNQQQQLPNNSNFQEMNINFHGDIQTPTNNEFAANNTSKSNDSNVQSRNLLIKDSNQQQQQVNPVFNNDTFRDGSQVTQGHEFAPNNALSSRAYLVNTATSKPPTPTITESVSDSESLQWFMSETEALEDFEYGPELMDMALNEYEPFFDSP